MTFNMQAGCKKDSILQEGIIFFFINARTFIGLIFGSNTIKIKEE